MLFQLLSPGAPGRGVAGEGGQIAHAAAPAICQAVDVVQLQRPVAVFHAGLVSEEQKRTTPSGFAVVDASAKMCVCHLQFSLRKIVGKHKRRHPKIAPFEVNIDLWMPKNVGFIKAFEWIL